MIVKTMENMMNNDNNVRIACYSYEPDTKEEKIENYKKHIAFLVEEVIKSKAKLKQIKKESKGLTGAKKGAATRKINQLKVWIEVNERSINFNKDIFESMIQ